MVNQAIFEGLKRATKKGETLRKAMISFYNAGYPKEEIEEAARLLKTQSASTKLTTQSTNTPKKIFTKTSKPIQKISSYGNKIPVQKKQITKPTKKVEPKQKVSDYPTEQLPKKKSWIKIVLIILIIIIILFLIGIGISYFFFNDWLTNILTKIF